MGMHIELEIYNLALVFVTVGLAIVATIYLNICLVTKQTHKAVESRITNDKPISESPIKKDRVYRKEPNF